MDRKFQLNNFDLLRLFAAVEVLLLHSFPRLQLPFPAFFKIMSNFPGVSMFFVMSGFLISASLERNSNLKNYFKNRALRIFPALWACIILTIIIIALSTRISFINKDALPWFFSQCIGIIYTPAFLKDFGFGSYNGSLWTIPLELQFYLVLPVLYFVVNKLSKNETYRTIIISFIFLIFCILTYLIKIYLTKGEFEVETTLQKSLRYTFIPNIYLFLFGVVLQRLKVYKSNLIYGKGLIWLIGYIIINYLIPTSAETYILKLLALGVTTISLAYTAPLTANKILKGNDISYGVYIYHGLVLGFFVELELFKNSIHILSILLITVVLAILSWQFVEKPFMRRKKKTIHEVTKVDVI